MSGYTKPESESTNDLDHDELNRQYLNSIIEDDDTDCEATAALPYEEEEHDTGVDKPCFNEDPPHSYHRQQSIPVTTAGLQMADRTKSTIPQPSISGLSCQTTVISESINNSNSNTINKPTSNVPIDSQSQSQPQNPPSPSPVVSTNTPAPAVLTPSTKPRKTETLKVSSDVRERRQFQHDLVYVKESMEDDGSFDTLSVESHRFNVDMHAEVSLNNDSTQVMARQIMNLQQQLNAMRNRYIEQGGNESDLVAQMAHTQQQQQQHQQQQQQQQQQELGHQVASLSAPASMSSPSPPSRTATQLNLLSSQSQTELQAPSFSYSPPTITSGPSKLKFANAPTTVLIIKKPDQAHVSTDMVTLCKYLMEEKGLTIYTEPAVVLNEPQLAHLKMFDPKYPGKDIDFAITLGGDGTVLYYNSLFTSVHKPIPPVVSFALGSLGFLTPFSFVKHRDVLDVILNAHTMPVFVCARMRLLCKVQRAKQCIPNPHCNSQNIASLNHSPPSETDVTDLASLEYQSPCFTSQPLNEIVLNRSLSSMALIQLFVDGHLVTTVRADGLIVASPTGSTGYSMSAGGPMLAPSTPALIITPLCPHNLSFRPVVVCDSTLLRLRVSTEMNCNTPLIASFDGRTPTELYPGDSVQITMSPLRVPSIVFSEFNTEWFKSIKHKLHWNASFLDKKR